MNRVIKFRAWHNILHVMYPDVHLLDTLNEMIARDNYAVMQFTGLIDKNGKEIYEGDIVKCFSFAPAVIYQDGCFGYMTSDNPQADFIPLGKNYHFAWNNGQSAAIEIIGNIYETPELLNQSI